MNAQNFDLAFLLKMRHSPLHNYVVPGLTSWLIGNPSPKGTLRLFECEREQQEAIAPHSHRFDFQCWVLRGSVKNRIWSRHTYPYPEADRYQSFSQRYGMEPGQYQAAPGDIAHWSYRDHTYCAEECYAMERNQVHSIFFSRGALVLFFEGETKTDTSLILQPVSRGETVEAYHVEPWMFARGAAVNG